LQKSAGAVKFRFFFGFLSLTTTGASVRHQQRGKPIALRGKDTKKDKGFVITAYLQTLLVGSQLTAIRARKEDFSRELCRFFYPQE
jgi:hypothetical protein